MTRSRKIVAIFVLLLIIILGIILIVIFKSKNEKEKSIYVSISDAVKTATDVVGNQYQNLEIPDNIDIDGIEKAYIISANRSSKETDIRSQLDKLSIAYTGQKPDTVYQSEDNVNTMIGEITGKYYLEYSSSNTFHAYRLSDWRAEEEREPTEVFDLNKDDITSVSYKVANQDYLLSEAVACAEDFINNNLLQFMPNDTELKLSKAYVFKSGSNYFYCFSGVHYIEGIPLSTVGTGSTDEAHMNGVDFRIYIDEPNIIGEIRNFRYPYFTNKEEVKEIVSLESALSYLEDYLAPYGEYKISNISLEYCSKDNGDNGNSFTYHPTWCFTINKYQTNVYQLEPKRVLYLDAINKEVFCWDDVQFEFIFGDNIKNNMNQ